MIETLAASSSQVPIRTKTRGVLQLFKRSDYSHLVESSRMLTDDELPTRLAYTMWGLNFKVVLVSFVRLSYSGSNNGAYK